MSELVPVPLDLQLRRAFLEFEREGKIFDLPKDKFFLGLPGLDTSVRYNGHPAFTPLGPAAGPHTQLLQNIVLCWLGGARIIELKTVQILDELKIPRPCIDSATVTYNVEWSQELKLQQSLREYVTAAMFLRIFRESKLLGEALPADFYDTVFDMSAGYNLEGIRSPRVRAWIKGMKQCAPVVDELRASVIGRFARYRDIDFPDSISDTITLSTFHGCPAREIEGIVTFLLEELGLNVCVKMNPTLLGREQVAYLLHDVLGYRDIELNDGAFANDLKFDEALDLVPRLQSAARACGRQVSLKFSNTLVVRNTRSVFADELMYMSGAPLHVITLNLVKQFRERMRAPVPLSFSAGLTANNMADMVAMNFVPVTTCTDLLKTGGYGRLHKYMEKLGAAMQVCGARNISEFVVRHAGQAKAAADQDAAGLLNTPVLVECATHDARYRWEQNKVAPRKLNSQLSLFDCVSCDKCVPACPNDANFEYQVQATEIAYQNYELTPGGGFRAIAGGVFKIAKQRQWANYADLCNDCGNCDWVCPEHGQPNVSKPRFFGSLETYNKYANQNGFYLEFGKGLTAIHGTISGKQYRLAIDRAADCAHFEDEFACYVIQPSCRALVSWTARHGAAAPAPLDLLPYLQMELLLNAVSDSRHVQYANVAALEGAN